MIRNEKNGSVTPALARGLYAGHLRGFGFFVPEGKGKDLFVPAGREGNALDGDTVEIKPLSRDTARVVRVLERGRPLLAGTYLGRQAFIPDAHRIPRILRVEGKAEKGDKVLVATTPERFTIRRVLGRAGAPEVEDGAVLAELEITPTFPPAVLAAAEKLRKPDNADLLQRLDLRESYTVVTIDPLTSRDFDDAISLVQKNGEWLLGVHIADVSHFVQPDDPIDREAYQRGTSVYLPNRVIPMLPEKLSDDLCSLREGVDRPTLSVLLRYDQDGHLLSSTFAETVIRSNRRFSYERASRIMDKSRAQRGPVGKVLRRMVRLAALLKRQRPFLQIPRGETELVFNAAGDIVDLHSTAEDAAHGVIEEFMLAANREVARLMLAHDVPALFRHHPNPPDLNYAWETLALLGIENPKDLGLKRALAEAAASGFGPAASSALFRCFPRAVYTTSKSSHFSLGFEEYLHFTSPIRRYTDLVTHRQLRKLIKHHGGPIELAPDGKQKEPIQDPHLEKVAVHLNTQSAAADRAESRIRRQRVLEFLLRQGGIPTEGQITTVVEKGLVIDLQEYGTSGFLAVDLLPGGPFKAEPGVLKGKKSTYRLGDTLEVCVHRIDPAASQLDLALAPRY